jgi:hypothetical protein
VFGQVRDSEIQADTGDRVLEAVPVRFQCFARTDEAAADMAEQIERFTHRAAEFQLDAPDVFAGSHLFASRISLDERDQAGENVWRAEIEKVFEIDRPLYPGA